MSDKEIRAGVEFRLDAGEDGATRKLDGYAAVFGQTTRIGAHFVERIDPGAFEGRLSDDVRLLINHDGLPLARTVSGTLRLDTDNKGLRVDADLNADDPDVARLIPKMERGDLNQMSFAFSMSGGVEEWDDSQDPPLRTIKRVGRIMDVAVVTYPAYPTTEAALRSLEEARAHNAPVLTGPSKIDALRRALDLHDLLAR
jgi:HK97 family phage prohead protease